jgi:DNA-binding beta-propeller fold protein YncE
MHLRTVGARTSISIAMLALARCSSSPSTVADAGPGLTSCALTSTATRAGDVDYNWEAWVAREDANELRVLNGPEFAPRKAIDLSPTMLTHPRSIAFSADTTVAYVAMGGAAPKHDDAGLVWLDANMRKVTNSLSVAGADLVAVAVRPSFSTTVELWLLSTADDAVRIVEIDAMTSSVSRPYKIGATGAPAAIRFNSDGSKAYVASSGVKNMNSAVSVFDAESRKVIATYATGAGTSSLVIGDDDTTMWIANTIDNSVGRIDLTVADTKTATMTLASGVTGASAVALEKYNIAVLAPGDQKVEFFSKAGEKLKELAIPGTFTSLAISPTCVDAYAIEPSMGFFDVKTPKRNDGTSDFANFRVTTPPISLMGMSPVGLIVRAARPAM